MLESNIDRDTVEVGHVPVEQYDRDLGPRVSLGDACVGAFRHGRGLYFPNSNNRYGYRYCSLTTTPSPSKRILNPASPAFSIITFSSDLSSITVGMTLPVQATRAFDEIDSGYSRVTRSVSGSMRVEMASDPLPKIFTVSTLRW